MNDWRDTDKKTRFGGLTRSALMSRIRSKKNSSTELRLVRLLRLAKIKGWRRHARLPGRPDFIWRREHLAVFLDGCYWHGHNCRNLTSKTNAERWRKKIEANKRRDRKANRELRRSGWTVIRIWECRLAACVEKIKSALI
jgi:DNA mismatch endonuclease (patch repair protein)